MQNVINGFPTRLVSERHLRYDDAIAMLILAPNCIG